jgi:hypothetical protein
MLSKKRILNKVILEALMQDLQISISAKLLILKDVASLVKSLYNFDLLTRENSNTLINYLVDMGYDSDDY